MPRVMPLFLLTGFCLLVLSCDSTQDDAKSPSQGNQSSKNSADETFAKLSHAPVEQPLPAGLELAVLTAVETEEGFVVELIDPSLTDADAGTGLVATYLLYGEGTDSEARFRQSAERLREDDARPLALEVTEETICHMNEEGARCVTGAKDYLLETAYLPDKPSDDMQSLMEEVIRVLIAHYEANV